MGRILLQKWPAFLSLILLVMSLRPQPTSGFQMLSEDQIRQLNLQGHTSFHHILSMVMMGLPESLVESVTRQLQFSANSGNLENTLGQQNAESPSGGTGSDVITNAFKSDAPVQLKRKRRFSDLFGGYNNKPGFNFPDFGGNVPEVPQNGNLYGGNANGYINYTDDSSSRSSSGYHDSFYRSFNFGNVECPRQVDQGFVYQYSADPDQYPAVDIANELLARSLPNTDLLFQCLSRQVVFPSDPPQIFQDPFLPTSNATCQFEENQLWSYESVTFTGRCFPLVNFQETPFFKRCSNRFCQCRNDDFFFNNKANICITEYETLSVWSYCERLLPNRRIVRDRILVPDACTCSSVQCSSGFHHK